LCALNLISTLYYTECTVCLLFIIASNESPWYKKLQLLRQCHIVPLCQRHIWALKNEDESQHLGNYARWNYWYNWINSYFILENNSKCRYGSNIKK
jgi:hypothetical protein